MAEPPATGVTLAELDRHGLGRLERVTHPRLVWTSESGDFTPWLAANLDVLAEELDLPLTLEATEVAVGDFRLDIQARGPDGRIVIVENQLERTDHGHLGQLLAYAAGLDAATVVWVAPEFREDHRRTLDFLNENTVEGLDFFGVEVGIVRIGTQGPPAPVFEVVSRPNDWSKAVKAISTGLANTTFTDVNTAAQEFFSDVLDEVLPETSSSPSRRGSLSASERDELLARSIGIVEGAVSRILVENDQLCRFEVDGERVVARDALFIRPLFVPNDELLVSVACQVDETGW